MRHIKDFKKLLFDSFLVSAILALTIVACDNKNSDNDTMNRNEDSKEVAEDRNDEMIDNNKIEKDAQFLVNAAEINLEEIKLGQLAQTNATMADVKDLGKMMEDQHNKTFTELKDLAAKKNIAIPTTLTEENQDDYKKLIDKKGNDFDKEYCDMMVKGHKDAIDKFEKASTDATDADIKQWASATLPALRNHLEHAMACQDKAKGD